MRLPGKGNNKDVIYCMNCGKEIKSYYTYCIFCGKSTEDNPKCKVEEKESALFQKKADDLVLAIEAASDEINDDEIRNKANALAEKFSSMIPAIKGRSINKELSSAEKSLLNRYMPMLVELIDKYTVLEDNADDASLKELNEQLTSGIDNFCNALDSINKQINENEIMDISCDLEVLETILKKHQ